MIAGNSPIFFDYEAESNKKSTSFKITHSPSQIGTSSLPSISSSLENQLSLPSQIMCSNDEVKVISIGNEHLDDHGVPCLSFQEDFANTPERKCVRHRKKSMWIVIVALTVLVGIAVIATVSIVSKDTTKHSVSDKGDNSQVIQSDAFYQERFAVLSPLVGMYSEASTFLQTGSPQSLALKWLVYNDQTIDHTSISDQKQLRQRYAMMVLFYACGGEGWQGFDQKGFLSEQVDTQTCDLDIKNVIDCEKESQEVTALTLASSRLGGVLPEELSLLTKLEVLDLSDNFLKGTIPESYYENLTNLRKLTVNSSYSFLK